MTAHAQDVSAELAELVFGLMHAIKGHVVKKLAQLDLTPSQADALRNLEQPCSQRELAQCLHFDASNITDIADRLEARGLIERRIDPQDRRVRRLMLTSQGTAIRDELFGGFLQDAPFFQTLTATEQAALHDLLGKMVKPVALTDSKEPHQPR
ncbi:MAG TPA: MarR family transcriptional regulator [Acidimicrobiia bacterium]